MLGESSFSTVNKFYHLLDPRIDIVKGPIVALTRQRSRPFTRPRPSPDPFSRKRLCILGVTECSLFLKENDPT